MTRPPRRLTRIALFTAGVVMMGYGAAVALTGVQTIGHFGFSFEDGPELLDQLLFQATVPMALWFGGGAFMGYFGSRLYNRSRRYGLRLAADIEAIDTRPPILYLRSFADDAQTEQPAKFNISFIPLWGMRTHEESLVDILSSAGPVIAVGRPGEELPEIGAARFYVEADQWHRRVAEEIERASFVVLRPQVTEGLIWESEHLVQSVQPAKLLILVTKSDAYEAFARRGASFPRGLPPESFGIGPGILRGDPSCDINGLVCFEADWTARFLDIKSLWSARRALRRAFGSLCKTAGIEGVRDPFSARVRRFAARAAAIVLALALGGPLAYSMYQFDDVIYHRLN